MEVGSALGVPDGSPLLAAELRVVAVALALIPDRISDTSAVRGGLIAEGTIITELAGAVLPADGADTVEPGLAKRVAQSTILFLTSSARGDDLAGASSIGILPARRASNVQGGSQEQEHSSG